MDGDAVNTLDPWFKRFCTKLIGIISGLAPVLLSTRMCTNWRGSHSDSKYKLLHARKLFSCVYVLRKTWKKKTFLDVGVQRRLRNVQKCVMHVQSCCFANLNLLIFCHLRCLNSLISLMVKTEKRANKVPISKKKYCYSAGMWVDCLCQRSPVEKQIHITN